MPKQGSLFNEDRATTPTFSVDEINSLISDSLFRLFPNEIWVRGEISGLKISRNGHAYFDLVEDQDETSSSAISSVIYIKRRLGVEQYLSRYDLRLQEGMSVRFRGQIRLYAQRGQLNFVITGVDPGFSIGDRAAKRQADLQTLHAEGLLEKNSMIPLVSIPLNLALITSSGSAAHHDVMAELNSSPWAFSVSLFDVQVQGEDSLRQVLGAIARAQDSEADLVIIARGGGSTNDLLVFDSIELARAIANCTKPVITGIGHEIDVSLCDVVAHREFKTPTAAAGFLVETIRSEAQGLHSARQSAISTAGQFLAHHQHQLKGLEAQLRRWPRHRMVLEADLLSRSHQRLLRVASRALASESDRVSQTWHSAITKARQSLQARHDQKEALRVGSIRSAKDTLAASQRLMAGFLQQITAHDPDRVLRRGYTITTHTDGGRVHPGSLSEGQTILTRGHRLAIGSTVTKFSVEQTSEPTQNEMMRP